MKRLAVIALVGLLIGPAAHATDPDTEALASPDGMLNQLLHKRYEKMLNDAQSKAEAQSKAKSQSTADDAKSMSKPGDQPATVDARTPNPKAIDPKTVLVRPKTSPKPTEQAAQKVDLKHGTPSPQLNHPEHHHFNPPPEFHRVSPPLAPRQPISTGPMSIPQLAEPAQ